VPQPFRSVVLEEVGSTNREAFARADAGETGPLWIMARRQTAGRGRVGRLWTSDIGNLHASLLVKLPCPPAAVSQLSLLAGVATVDAMARTVRAPPVGVRLKWPNDVLIGHAKCAGILAESLVGRDAVTAVIGVGINLASHPADIGREATHLAAHGVQVAPEAMLGFLASAMQHWLDVWDCGAGFALVRAAWLERAGPVGESCSVNTGTERISGKFLDLDPHGALLLRDGEGQQRTVSFGDVTLAPPASGSRDDG